MSRSEEKWAMTFWIVLAWWGCTVGGELLVCCGWLRRKFVCVESWDVYAWREEQEGSKTSRETTK